MPLCNNSSRSGFAKNILESVGRRGKDEKRLLGWMFGQGEALVRWYSFRFVYMLEIP